MKKRVLVIAYCLQLHGFNLDTAQQFAASRLEFPPVENKNVYNPEYTKWHRAHQPSFIDNLLESIGFRKPLWSAKQFMQLLTKVTKARETEGLAQPHELLIKAVPDSAFIIFGPLFGSYHSLVRSLTELQRQGYLDKQLKLRNATTTIVFVGNVINGTPYNLETLSLVMQLMHTNPGQVFYCKGKHETGDFWKGYGLEDELSLKLNDQTTEKLITRFFATLPLAVLIESAHAKEGVIRVAAEQNEAENFSFAECVKTAAQASSGSLTICPVRAPAKKGAPLAAEIVAEGRLRSYRRHPGLIMTTGEMGSPAWRLFSAPNALYRDHFHFNYDAFAVLILGASFQEAVLVLYNQDIREQNGFRNAARFDPLTGKWLITHLVAPKGESTLIPSPAVEKQLKECKTTTDLTSAQKKAQVEPEPIILGCTLDLTKGASGQGKLLKEGLTIGINRINRMGGIKGRSLKIIFMDDEYNPEKARANIEHFLKTYKSTLFIGSLGSPTMQSYIDLIRDNKIFVFFPTTGAPIFRTPEMKGVVHWMASYSGEAKVMTRYLHKQLQVNDFGFLYQDDSFGQGALEGSSEYIKKAGINPGISVKYERNTTNFKSQIEKLKAGTVHGMCFWSTAVAAREFIRQAGVDFFIGKRLCALSDLGEVSFRKFAEQKGLEIITASFCPNPATSMLPIAQDFRQALYQQGYDRPDVFMLGGYICAVLTADILTKAAPSLTHESFMKVIESMDNYKYKGLTLTFDPKTRELAHMLWLMMGTSPEWLEQNVND